MLLDIFIDGSLTIIKNSENELAGSEMYREFNELKISVSVYIICSRRI